MATLKREQEELARLQTGLKRLERLKLAWPHAAKLRVVRAEVQTLGEFIPLPESASHERLDAERRERESIARQEHIQNKIARIQAEIEKLQAPEELIRQALAIAGANQRLGAYREALRDLPSVRVETKRDQADADAILRSLRPDANSEAGESFHISILARERIEALANRYAALEQRVADATKRQGEAAGDLVQEQGRLSPEVPLSDPAKLRQVLNRVHKEGDLEAVLRAAQAKLKLLDEQAQREIARLGRWRGTGEELEQAALPGIETVGRFEDDLARAEQTHREALQQLEQVREKLRQAETKIQTLQLGGEVPTERELESKRERREEGWQLVRQAWLKGGADEAREQAFHPEKPLAEAYEEAVTEADVLADRLRREAKRVGQLAELIATRDESRERVSQAEDACEKARIAHENFQKAWQAVWQTTGIESASPREMRAWLTQCAGVLRMLDEVRQQRSAVEQSQALIENRAAELREELTALGEKATATASLGALIDCASTLLVRIEEAQSSKEAHDKELKRLTQVLQKAEREAEQAAGELRAWRGEWSAAVAPLTLGQEPDASQALAVLRQIDRFQEKKKAAADGLARIASMEGVIAQFEKEVAAVVEAVAPDLKDINADQAVGQLQARLTEAQQNAAKRQALEKQLTQEQEQLEASVAEIRVATADLARLLQAAKCVTREELIAVEEKAAKARELARENDELLRAIAPLSGGSPMEDFLAQLDGIHSDELDSESGAITAQIAERDTAIGELQTTRGQQQAELNAMDGGEKAAQAHEEAQETAAEIESLSARYLRLRLASGILRRQIERYREENQGPVVRRASELFPRLTRDSFSGLRTGFDEKDRPVLMGLRATGEEVPVAGMSEGTRDQLFLALRLASLERQMEASEPVPVVLDDILISFDNDRARRHPPGPRRSLLQNPGALLHPSCTLAGARPGSGAGGAATAPRTRAVKFRSAVRFLELTADFIRICPKQTVFFLILLLNLILLSLPPSDEEESKNKITIRIKNSAWAHSIENRCSNRYASSSGITLPSWPSVSVISMPLRW